MLPPVRTGSVAANVVTLAEAKAHLRVTATAEETLIQSLIDSAVDHVAERVGRVLGEETWQWSFRVDGPVILPVTPVQAITAITYLDQTWQVQTLDPDDFVISGNVDAPELMPGYGLSWPTTATRDDAITVTMTAGMVEVPPGLKSAILLLVGHWFANREAVTERAMAELPAAVESLINVHRRGWVAA